MEINKDKLKRFILIIIAFIITLLPILWQFFKGSEELAVLASGKTSVNRIEFLKSFGWEVSTEVVEENIVIPMEFNKVYEDYNKLQRSQGYDLRDFRGESATKFTYQITNYPKPADGDFPINIVANILVFEGKIIGGDVCSMELNGFLHGFKLP